MKRIGPEEGYNVAMVSAVTRKRFTAAEYHRMVQAGILHEDDRVELIEGEIVQMSPIGRRHAACVNRLTRLFSLRLQERVIVQVQGPVRLDPRSEVQPDLVLLRPRDDFYEERYPAPEDVLLIVEVADTSQAYDRQIKAPLYARAGILEMWFVDLGKNCVEVYRQPSENGYLQMESFEGNQTLSMQEIADFTVPVSAVIRSSN